MAGCGSLIIGTCGFQKSRKRHYEALDAVEIQQTFYDPPPPETLAKWRREAPPDFVFTVKAWMLITHGYNARLWRRLKRQLPYEPESFKPFDLSKPVLWALEVTLEAARALNTRILVFQTPASFEASRENLERVIRFYHETGLGSWEVYWEPRGSWWDEGKDLLDEAFREGIRIAGDILRDRRPPAGQEILYARLHGLGGRGEVNYKYKYTDADLERLLDIAGKWRRAYIMFNNVYAFDDAVRFKSMACQRLQRSGGG
jgi:uncharacterized protein YecE (DUF72 family)